MSPIKRRSSKSKQKQIVENPKDFEQIKIYQDIQVNIDQIIEIFGKSPELVTKVVRESPTPYSIAFLRTLANETRVDENITEPLVEWGMNSSSGNNDVTSITNHLNVSSKVKQTQTFKEIVNGMLDGCVILFVQNSDVGLKIPVEPTPSFRKVEETKIQTVVRGPREGLVEDLDTNMSLLRRRVRNSKLRFSPMKIGKETHTKVVVTYVDDLVDQKTLDTIMERLNKIDTNKILDSGMVEELIEDRRYTPFPTIKSTERPDIVCGEILDGRVAVLVDGSPFALVAPVTFVSFFHIAEDYYEKFDLATFIRSIRLLAFWISLALPATYIAVTTFHAELLPTNILINLAAQREGVPFPAFIEVIMMEIIFELLREAGIRMPRPIGSAISIVGALVIGEAAVQAGLISAAMVIVVSLTAITSFISPYYAFSGAVRMLRFVLILFAATSGFFGMAAFTIAMVIHLSNVTSIGKSYLSPIAPLSISKLKDVLFRFPLWWDKSKFYRAFQKIKRVTRG
ncbi:spore germination protein [Pontibacillus yanchengensis]|uniref:Spore gernimation protein KA n=1 Tax=Pontibacillus yanchengensis Y32 TaxID=1385514 RepID=A0A0A2TU89_9BACI|nr:spore germination protein [Pontibacillus yanchengensis]KGP72810.1 spore gernimation protein KA [Pontibacillus yanchengensis Y32]